jgi:hypothetical protein
MDTHRPPHFDNTNFPHYIARMACYLQVVDLSVWRVTRDGMKPSKNPEKLSASDKKESHLNARAKIACMNLLAWTFSIKYLLWKMLMRFD